MVQPWLLLLQAKHVEDEQEREKNVQTILAMFGNDLSRSVISTVYQQNDGDVAQAVDMLLDIYHDEEAIEAIRTMGAQQKKKLEAEMKAEQEKRNAERQVASSLSQLDFPHFVSYSNRLVSNERLRRRGGD